MPINGIDAAPMNMVPSITSSESSLLIINNNSDDDDKNDLLFYAYHVEISQQAMDLQAGGAGLDESGGQGAQGIIYNAAGKMSGSVAGSMSSGGTGSAGTGGVGA